MDALKKSVERAGCTMDSIIHLQVFLCLPLADTIPMPTGKARFDAHKAQYDALNKIYGTYFSPGKAPSRACMAVEWIPGDSLIEIVGSAMVVTRPLRLPINNFAEDVEGKLGMNLKLGWNRRSFLAALGATSSTLLAPARLSAAGIFGKKPKPSAALYRRRPHRTHHHRPWFYGRYLRRAGSNSSHQHQWHRNRHRRVGDAARSHGADPERQRALRSDR